MGANGQKLSWDEANRILKLTDSFGNVTEFFDVRRASDETNSSDPYYSIRTSDADRPVAHSAALNLNQKYGKFKRYISADGSIEVAANYDSNGYLTSVTRSDLSVASGNRPVERYRYDYTGDSGFATLTNDLVTSASQTPPRLIARVTLERSSNGGSSWSTVRLVDYTYYTGRVSSGGGFVNDSNGRLGDLKLAEVKDAAGSVIDTKYYRYYKFTGEGDITVLSKGPTNQHATTGGPDPVNPADGYDPDNPDYYNVYVTSGLKSVTEGASFSRLAANHSDYSNATDTQLKTYLDNYFEYERWGDHVGTGASDNYGWRIGYRFGTRYRVTFEIAQGAGCSSCSGGQGAFKIEYHSNNNSTDIGFETLQYNTWRIRNTEYLPDTTDGTWDDNDQRIVYANEMGLAMLEILVDRNGTTSTSDDQSYLTYYRYSDSGQLTHVVHPSALSGYSESYADLVNWSTSSAYISQSSGLVDIYEYATSTTSSLGDGDSLSDVHGDVTGHLKAVKVSQGFPQTNGSNVKTVSSQTYYKHSYGGADIFPVARMVSHWDVDRNGTDDSVETKFTYTWRLDSGSTQTNRILSKTEYHPAVVTGRNGAGTTSDSTTTVYDAVGRVNWFKDEDNKIHYSEYDQGTGKVKKRITDVDTDLTGDFSNLPSGWSNSSGLHIKTEYQRDGLGRVTKMTDPNGNVTHTVYKDALHEIRTYRSGPGSFSQVGPVYVVREYRPGAGASSGQRQVYFEQLTSSETPTLTSGVPNGSESIAYDDIKTLSRQLTNDGGQVVESDVYTSLASYAQPTPRITGVGTSVLTTKSDYDGRGRAKRIESPDGTITRTLYDARDLVVATWKGTDDTPTSGSWSPSNQSGANLVKVRSAVYDISGNMTESRQVLTHNSSTGADSTFYANVYQYDFRNRLTAMRRPDNLSARYTLDNAGQMTTAETFADDEANFSFDSGELRQKSESFYDDRGRVYLQKTYEVNPTTGAVADSLSTNYWYDARGNLAKTRDANGLQHKSVYDGAGRLSKTYITIDSNETSYSEINSVTDDRVIEQNHIVYDPSGNVVHTLSMKRKNDSPSTGALNSETSWSQAIVNWYDAADRIIATANYGSELRGDYLLSGASVSPTPTRAIYNRTSGSMIDSDSDGIPNVAEGSVPITPTWTTDEQDQKYIINKFFYDAAGRLYRMSDNMRRVNTTDQGRITETQFDLAGRKTKVIENYVDGVANSNDMDFDRVTDYQYHTTGPVGQLSAIVAYNVRGSSYGLGVAQSTKFSYDSAIDHSWVTDTIYPDSDDTSTTDGTDGLYDRVETDFDRLGRKTSEKDQRGVTHTFTYDSAGRFSSDSIGTGSLPNGVDGTVRTIEYGYDDQSRVNLVSSKNAAGTVINQVKTTFDGWGNVIKSEQDHAGAVSGSTPSIQYSYADGASAGVAKYVRLDTVTYPNGRVIKYNYNTTGSDDDVLSRVDTIRDNTLSKDLVEYNWVGAYDLAGEEKHPSVSGGLTLTWGFGGNLMLGWDRFGRILKHQWRSSGTTVELDRFDYKYDNAGNRVNNDRHVTISDVTLDDNYSESFEYDGLDRLVDYRRGKLSSGIVPKLPTDSTNLLYRQTWATLDSNGVVTGSKLASQGNWMEWTVDTNGGTAGGSTTQVRNVNSVNEIDTDNVDGDADDPITGNSWIDPIYDKSGNMTTAPKGQGSETTAVYFVYDGWNRVAGISATQTHDGDFADTGEVQYEYDGMGRRISKDFAGGSTSDEDTYFNEEYQVVEMRKAGSSNPYEQYVWDLRYIDAPILRYRNADGNTGSGTGGMEETLYTTYDANFNITGLVQENQTFVERYVYTPYGDRTVLTGTFGSRSSTSYDFQLGHQGLRIDGESGTYFNRARQLHAGLGNFTARDPLGFEYQDGMGLYQYLRGNPVMSLDPSGRAARVRSMVDPRLLKQQDLNRQKLKEQMAQAKREDGFGGWGSSWLNMVYYGAGFAGSAQQTPVVTKAAEGAADGAMAWANGFVPFYDPFGKEWFFEPCDEMLWWSEMGGNISREAWLAAAGLKLGQIQAGRPGPGKEFSHWIPNRHGGPVSIWNGNYVDRMVHVMSDPYRYRFMPRLWKMNNPMPSVFVQQWVRIPYVWKGLGGGMMLGAADDYSEKKDCPCD
jgi:RHS repeat-associated protein